MSVINLTWDGATDDTGIAGYEITYILGNGTTYIDAGFVPHIVGGSNTLTSGGGSYSHTITQFVNHTFRIRTKDVNGQYSGYFTQQVSVIEPSLRSFNSSLNTINSCSLTDIPNIPIYIGDLDINQMIVNNVSIMYTDSNFTLPFNGQARNWKIKHNNILYSVRVNTNGLIKFPTMCNSLEITYQGIRTRDYITVSSSANTYGPICNATLSTNFYYTGFLVVGTILYTNVEQTSILNSGSTTSRYYRVQLFETIQSGSNPYYILRVSNTGNVIEKISDNIACQISVCCFVGETKVKMSDLSDKSIKDIVIGDLIITYNEDNGEQEINEVLNVMSPNKNTLVEYTLSDNTIIKSTPDHPYWVIGKGWSSYNPVQTLTLYNIEVSYLEINDSLLSLDGTEIKLIDMKLVKLDDSLKTYNLSVSNNNNYYVNNILVHNKTEPTGQNYCADAD
jgi:Ataxin-1 and HBP1 module (AXH)